MARKYKRRKIPGQFFPITRVMRTSEAWKQLSPHAVYLYTELMGKYRGDDNEELTLPYGDYRHKMCRDKFYEARSELVTYGFFYIPEGKGGGLGHQKTKFIIRWNWQSISAQLKMEKDRKAQSERDKARFREKQKEENQEGTLDDLLP